MGTGQAPVKRYNRQLRNLIITGVARPGKIVSHEVGLDEAVDAYDKFDCRVDGCTKVLLHPFSQQARSAVRRVSVRRDRCCLQECQEAACRAQPRSRTLRNSPSPSRARSRHS